MQNKLKIQCLMPSRQQSIQKAVLHKLTAKDRLQNYLRFCFQKSLLFKAFWKQCSVSYFATIPKQ